MPARLVQQQHRMGARRDRLADLLQLGRHRLGIAVGQNETRTLALGRADRPEDVGPGGPLVVRCPGPCAASGPAPGDLVLLPDAGLVMPPHLYLGAVRQPGSDRLQRGGQAFLNASLSNSFWA